MVAMAAAFMLAVGAAAGGFLWLKGHSDKPREPWRGVAQVTVKLPPLEAAPPPEPAKAAPAEPPPPPIVPPAAEGAAAKPTETPPPPPLPAQPAAPRPAAAPPKPQAAAAPAAPAPPPAPAVPEVSARLGEVQLALFDPALSERGKDGALPIVGRDGRQPWRVYARPYDPGDKRPRIAIVVTNMGLSVAATDHAINALPGAITLAFAPFADGLKDAINRARSKGHEILLNAPMEPESYPRSDPGPNALLTSLSEAENQDRLAWILTRGEAYVGIANLTGGRFAQSPEHLQPVLKTLRQRGLLYLDRWVGPQSQVGAMAKELELPFAGVQFVIDQEPTKAGIDGRLAELERAARRDGRVVGLALPYPLTLERIAIWASGIDTRGVILAPVSAVTTMSK